MLVVGGGPTGLTMANLLGAFGVRAALLERNDSTSAAAKAISLDDESLRTMQMAGLDSAIYPIIVPGTGTRYFSSRHRPLLHARGPKVAGHAHPFKSSFAQPDLERVLVSGLNRFPCVSVRFGTMLRAIRQTGDGVTAHVAAADGREFSLQARYLLGCDGSRSTVRELLGIRMTGRSFADRWLVADTIGDYHDERYGMHIADPSRPHVIIPGAGGRCRYEFRLFDGEATSAEPEFELIERLVGQYRKLDPQQVERAVVYGFHALLADSFRAGRCFLLGDAAHMMPPFAGQGLNSGVRDAMNLAWKLAAVLSGQASPALLESYEQERRPHAAATIRLSVRLGSIVMTTSRSRARVRDVLVRAAMAVPVTRRYLQEMRYRPTARFGIGSAVPDRIGRNLVGRPIPQPYVLAGLAHQMVKLDDVLGTSPAILGIDIEPAVWAELERADLRPLAGQRIDVRLDDRANRPADGRLAIADIDGRLEALLGAARGRFVFVRPDRVVTAVIEPRDLGRLAEALAPFRPAADGGAPGNAQQAAWPARHQTR